MTQLNCNQEIFHLENIYCVGRNYLAHIEELQHRRDDEMLVFLKPNTSIAFEGQPIQLPHYSKEVHYEGELVLLIGQDIPEGPIENPLAHIAGYALGVDLTARDIQREVIDKGQPWLKCKGFKQSALLSSFICSQRLTVLENIHFTVELNGQLVQAGDTSQMLYSIPEIIVYLQQRYGLKKGDIIYTGTPQGVGRLCAGDQLTLRLESDLLVAHFLIA